MLELPDNMTVREARGLGRYGDGELVHMSRGEIDALNAMADGGLTINPDTGHPEAFKLSKALGMALPLAAMLIPGVGPALSGALMSAGMGGGLAAALTGTVGLGALSAGAGSLIQGKSLKKSLGAAALGGLGGALTGGLGKVAGQGAQAAAPKAVGGLSGIGGEIAGSINTPELLAQHGAQLAQSGGKTAMQKALPYLGLAGVGLSAMAPKPVTLEEEENRNPHAGTEYMDPRVQRQPPPGYVPGSSQGEWLYFAPEDTRGGYYTGQDRVKRYADGGAVEAPIYDEAKFAGLFNRRPVANPTGLPGAYGDNGPATMNWVAPPKPIAPVVAPTPATTPAPLPQVPSSWADYGARNPDVAAEYQRLIATADRNSPQFKKLGLNNGLDGFAQWHYQNYGQKEGRMSPTPAIQSAPYSGFRDQAIAATQDFFFAEGGFVEGPGDGTSDSIATSINGTQPAALSDGEFVFPAWAVSQIGNGSSKAGARKLDAMLKGLANA